MFRFIHTSDLHIGRQFNFMSLLDEQALMLDQIIEHCRERKVDALVIAGDVYDISTPAREAIALFEAFLDRCRDELNLPVILISGNHDCPVRLGMNKKAVRQAGLYLLTDLADITQPVILGTDDHAVYFYGIPFCDPTTVRAKTGEPVKTYDEAHTFLVEQIKTAHVASAPKVLLSHCFVKGGVSSDSERTLSVGGSDQVSADPMRDFDYVALGHLHSAHHKGAEHIRYSGSPLKYSFSEAAHKKSVTYVEIAAGNTHHQTLPIIAEKDVRIIKGEFAQILADAPSDPKQQDFIRVDLTDTSSVLNPMPSLREYYPNLAEIRYVNRGTKRSEGADLAATHRIKTQTESEVVADFLASEGIDELNDNQKTLINDAINSLNAVDSHGTGERA